MVNPSNLRRRREVCTTAEESNSSANCRNGSKNLLQIVEEIVNKPSLTISKEAIRREIVQFFRESEKEGLETSSFKISLLDPLSRKRIRIPVRSVGCDHFQCFDLYNFLEFSYGNAHENGGEGKSAWHCLHCQAKAKQEQLRVDGYFQEILMQMQIGPEPQEVELFPDGSWKEVEQINFKEVLLGAMDNDGLEIVEMVPKKKLRILEQPGESTGIYGANAPLSGCDRCEETRQNFAEKMRELKRDSETVDALCRILGIDKNDGGEKQTALIETVQKLLMEKNAVKNLPEAKGTKTILKLSCTQKWNRQRVRMRRRRSAKKVKEGNGEKQQKGTTARAGSTFRPSSSPKTTGEKGETRNTKSLTTK